MVIEIKELINAQKLSDDKKNDALSHMVLEAIAIEKDTKIMTELMLEMLQRNATLNRELEHKIKEVERLSVTDHLTGLFNRRRFLDVLIKEIDRMRRYESPFSIIMFDIDHFKHVNDTYGHDVGDFVLKELSNIIQDRLRSADTFARWGGEEFLILAPEISFEDTLLLGEKLRELIESHDFSPVPTLTSSFGVISSADDVEISVTELTKAVDEALYEAKTSGRNCVVAYRDMINQNSNVEEDDVVVE